MEWNWYGAGTPVDLRSQAVPRSHSAGRIMTEGVEDYLQTRNFCRPVFFGV
jgi:hypothetical protein